MWLLVELHQTVDSVDDLAGLLVGLRLFYGLPVFFSNVLNIKLLNVFANSAMYRVIT